jgi:GH24 family phage-related lysozyme (muramidase)
MKRDYDARHAQSWGDSLTGVKPELAPETPEQEQARLSRYDSTTPTTAEQATAGPMTQPGLRPSDVAALADKPAPAPAPGVAATEPVPQAATGVAPNLNLPPSLGGAATLGGLPQRTFPLSASPLSPEDRVKTATAPAPANVPLPPRRPAPAPGIVPAAPAGAAARAPVDANGNPIEQFFSGLGRGVGDFFHGVGNIFTGGAQQVGNAVNSAGQTINRAGQVVGQTVNSAGQAVSNEVHGRINELMTGSPKMAPPAGNFHAEGVDPRLIKNLTEATRGLPQGWHAQMESGFRQGDPRQHGRGNAVDVALYDQNGRRVENYQNAATFRVYEKFAQDVRAAQQHNNPELNNAMRWGGYFSGGKEGTKGGAYGALDLMHFDLGGRQGLGMLGGNWENGLTAKQKALFPGVESAGMGQRPEGGYPTAVATSSDGARTSATGQVSPGYHNGVQGILAQEESFRDKPYWDKSAGGGGAWAIGYGTHMVAGADGKMRPVQPGDTITPQGAHQNMVQRLQTEFLPRAVQKVGGLDTWRALPRNVRDGLGSTIWNYGNLPDRVAFVIRNGGGPAEIANAVLQLGGKTEAARERRAREAAHIRGGG